MGNADGEGQERNESLVHKSFGVNESLVKAKPRTTNVSIYCIRTLYLCPPPLSPTTYLYSYLFFAATHPGVGGGTHRRRATFERG